MKAYKIQFIATSINDYVKCEEHTHCKYFSNINDAIKCINKYAVNDLNVLIRNSNTNSKYHYIDFINYSRCEVYPCEMNQFTSIPSFMHEIEIL